MRPLILKALRRRGLQIGASPNRQEGESYGSQMQDLPQTQPLLCVNYDVGQAAEGALDFLL